LEKRSFNYVSVNNHKIPFFSVILTTYNRAELLPRALNSLINQDEQDFEAIIVDDGSDDHTTSVAKEFCNKYSNFRYLYHSNRKQSQSRNAGILAASGMYMTFLDSDDEYKTNHLSTRKDIIIDYAEVDLIHGGIEIVGDRFVPDADNPGEMIDLSECVVGGTFFFRKELFFKLGGFANLNYADDYDFYLRAKAKKCEIAKVDFPSYVYYRDTPDSICNNLEI